MGSSVNKRAVEKRHLVCDYVNKVDLVLKMRRNDAKSVAIIALGCFHPVIKVQSASMHFFLGSDQEQDESEDEDDVGGDFML